MAFLREALSAPYARPRSARGPTISKASLSRRLYHPPGSPNPPSPRLLRYSHSKPPLSSFSNRFGARSLSTSHPGDARDDFGTYDIILPPEPLVWGVSHIPRRPVPARIARPPGYPRALEAVDPDADLPDAGARRTLIPLGGEEEHRMRAACRLAAETLAFAGDMVKPNVTTTAIDSAVHDFVVARGAYPSPLGYGGFPKACCTSVNNIAVHGIPDERPLLSGDLVTIDVTVYLDGHHGDTARTFCVGAVDEPGRALASAAEAGLAAGIAACGPGKPFRGIGRAIYDTVVREKDPAKQMTDPARASAQSWRAHGPFCISDAFSGHGIGAAFHRPPWIYHSLNDEPGTMAAGDCFTIEPVVIQGTDSSTWIFPDGWTASTENCARAAQAEHTVLITQSGVDVLTQAER